MTRKQFFYFAVIGISLNAALYGAYLLLTHNLTGSRAAMTITYFTGVMIGFGLNRRITFRFAGDNGSAFLRYIAAYAVGYAINFIGLWLLVDLFGIAHEIVQGVMIVGVSILLFILQKYWVFPTSARTYGAPCPRLVP
jgi:putative flippase GtrA